MDELKTFFGLCGLFIAWVLVGVVNVAIIEFQSLEQTWAVGILILWFLSGPVWVVVFLRWRGKRFTKAFNKLQDKLNRKTQERLKSHSTESETR